MVQFATSAAEILAALTATARADYLAICTPDGDTWCIPATKVRQALAATRKLKPSICVRRDGPCAVLEFHWGAVGRLTLSTNTNHMVKKGRRWVSVPCTPVRPAPLHLTAAVVAA